MGRQQNGRNMYTHTPQPQLLLTPTRIMTGIEVGGSSLPKARRHTVRVRGIDTEFCKSGPGVPEWYCCLYASCLYASCLYIVLVTSFSTHLEYL
jgi:hypothetical protein